MKWIDIPPVWLLVAAVSVWWIRDLQPVWLSVDHPLFDMVGGLCVGGGILLMVLAVIEMRKCRTTVIPHLEAAHLVRSGIFARTRNPIYLGDVLVLVGLALRWGTPIALFLVPLFIITITTRFILPEEDRLQRKFGDDFAFYCKVTRRWL